MEDKQKGITFFHLLFRRKFHYPFEYVAAEKWSASRNENDPDHIDHCR